MRKCVSRSFRYHDNRQRFSVWLSGFSADFIHSFLSICFNWLNLKVGFCSLIIGIIRSSKLTYAAFTRFSGCRSISGSFELKRKKKEEMTQQIDITKEIKCNSYILGRYKNIKIFQNFTAVIVHKFNINRTLKRLERNYLKTDIASSILWAVSPSKISLFKFSSIGFSSSFFFIATWFRFSVIATISALVTFDAGCLPPTFIFAISFSSKAFASAFFSNCCWRFFSISSCK